MSKLFLQEFAQFEYAKSTDDTGAPKKSKYGNLLVRGVLQRANTLNQNGRIYPRNVLEREVQNYMKMVKERRATGELDHADSPIVNLDNVSHVITELWWEGDALMGEVEILQEMNKGKQLQALFNSDIKVGISSRALGSVQKMGEADIVQDDLYLVCWDFVSEPSTPGAYMFKEAKEYSEDDLKRLFTRSDRIDRALNEVLSFKGKGK